MGPCFESIRVTTGFSVVSQWAQFTSGLADLLLNTGVMAEEEALDYVAALTEADTVLRRARSRVSYAPWRGGPRAYVTRRVCCFNYRGNPGSYCGALCPLVSKAEREADAVHTWENPEEH